MQRPGAGGALDLIGVPTGYPLTGSVRKAPAPSRPSAQTPISSAPQREDSARHRPTAKISDSRPVKRKLTVCIHPARPRASELTGWRKVL